MKRLVSTCHTGSDSGVNRRAGRGETCKLTWKHAAFKRGAKRGNIHISRRQYSSLLQFTIQFERAHLINGVLCDKEVPSTQHLPARAHALTCTRHGHIGAHGQVQNGIKDILFVIPTNIMHYAPNCFCTLLYAPIKSECCCFILPLNVFPIDHCTKDVINNLKA